ncbi:DEAD/DEAH box helicase [Desulfomicrobium baculatum]|nr:helicase-related protein [Desulfomicrobium baculatum]
MYQEQEPARRFLVADEVGLGKTLVARGLIASIVDHLKAKGVERIDVIYICSNADIARQNVSRLNITGRSAFFCPERLTLLPTRVRDLQTNSLNFISFTPGTTFNHGHRTGTKRERHLIYQMLRSRLHVSPNGLARLLQGNAGDGWRTEVNSDLDFDNGIADTFYSAICASSTISREIIELCAIYHDGRRSIHDEQRQRCLQLVGNLRRLLAKSCLDALRPNLVILDEFQRFKDLLGDPEENPVAELAQELFNYPNPDLRVLLLSATPYKMFARDDEEEDHYRDFLQTMGFLLDSPASLARLEEDLRMFRRALQAAGNEDDFEGLATIKNSVEGCLRRVMCRTERICATTRRDAMVVEKRPTLPLAAGDLADLRLVDAVGREVGNPDTLEYWKSSPYLLNFMKDYKLKQKLRERLTTRGTETNSILEILRNHPQGLLDKKRFAAYAALEPANARLRLLFQEVVDSGLWRLLWLPPSLPYWRPEGAFAFVRQATKTLIFSGWNVVPDAIATMLSYEVERLMVREAGRKVAYDNLAKRFQINLRLKGDPAKPQFAFRNQASHMTLALLFPSTTLAALADPLELASTTGKCPLLAEVRAIVAQRIRERLEPLVPSGLEDAEPDSDWYWRAIIFLERDNSHLFRDWCATHWSSARTGNFEDEGPDESDRFGRFLQSWLRTWDGVENCTGRPPDDLCEILADIALAGPAVCALRALHRASPGLKLDDLTLRNSAVFVAKGLCKQFNSPEATALVKGKKKASNFWQQVLTYCAEGNLQALLDEQVHVLRESLGLLDSTDEQTAKGIAEELHTALSIRTSTLRPDEIRVRRDRAVIDHFPIRCHYAMRFGEREEDKSVARKEAVRSAFNSPFRPFVLASTSVGQEGLDFHVWCHSVVHWNLPANPVDLEQREGRVHRYKGHAVRKNVADAFGLNALAGTSTLGKDPWRILFEQAHATRNDGCNDLVPYWIFETEGGAKVERRILAIPYSRDEGRYRRLQRSLALYRMVFGQPRQEDLLEYLISQFGPDQASHIAERWSIRLEPPGPPQR